MKKALLLICLLTTGAWAKTIAIKAGLLITDARKAPVANAVLVIEDGKVTSVGTAVPAGAEVIDLSAFTVMPGLMDGHAHLFTGDSGRDMRVSSAEKALYAQAAVRKALESGVTAMRVLGADDFIDVALRNTIDKGIIPGPRLLAAGHALSIPGGHGDAWPFSSSFQMADVFTPRRGFLSSPDQAEEAVHWQVKYGADLIKILASGGAGSPLDHFSQSSMSEEEIHRVVTIAHNLGKKVAAHAQNNRSIRWSIEAGIDSIEHGSDLDDATLALMKQKRVYLDMSPLHRLELAGKQFVNNQEVQWRKRRELFNLQLASFKLAAKTPGVLWSAGSDVGYSPGGPTLITELVTQAGYGLSTRDALISATVANADLFGLATETGTLEKGKAADLIGVRGNPLDDIRAMERVVLVMKAGKVYVKSF